MGEGEVAGDSIARPRQRFRKRFGRMEFVVLLQCDDIHIASYAIDKTECKKRTSPHDHKLKCDIVGRQVLTERSKERSRLSRVDIVRVSHGTRCISS